MITRRTFATSTLAAMGASILLPGIASGQPVDPSLLEALGAHAGYENGFRSKFTTGFYRRPVRGRPADASLITLIADRLLALSMPDAPTLALVHYAPPGAPMRTWLIESDGTVTGGVGSEPYRSADFLAQSLDVVRRGALRAPRKRFAPTPSLTASPTPPMPRREALVLARDHLLPGPVAARLATGKGRLLVLPARDSATVPFAALPFSDGTSLGRNWSVVILPDLSTLTDRRRVARYDRATLHNAVIVGDPELGDDLEYHWAELPWARREAQTIALLTGNEDRVMTGSEATHDRVVAAAGNFRGSGLLYLASHAVADPVNPMDGSFVALTGGRLTGTEIKGDRFDRWALDHPLVVLSACQTALGKTFDGGTFGVARAFVAGGAGQVVASLWNVDDEATYHLMTRFVETMTRRGLTIEDAMREAQTALADEYRDDPAAWASFMVFGAPGERTT